MADVDQADAGVSIDQPVLEVDTGDFHSYTGEDGNKQSWKSADELNQWIKQSGMFQADYTRKSQARESEYRKKMADLEKERSEWEKGDKAKYDRYNDAFNKRPQIAQQVQQLVDKPTSPEEGFMRAQGYVDEKSSELTRRLDALDAERAEEKLERERDAIYVDLEKEIPGFDRDKLSKALETLDGNDMKSLMTMVWKANQDPQEMQEKVEQNIAKKQGVGMLPTGGGPPKQSKGSTDPKIASEEAQAWANSS